MRARFGKVAALVVAFLIGVLFVGGAWAATTVIKGRLTVTGTVKAGAFTYTKPHTVLYNVSGSAFTTDSGTAVDHNGYSGQVIVPGNGTAVAPVYLPQGAIVTKVVVVSDGLTAGQLTLHLEASNFTGGHADMVALTSSNPAVCTSGPCLTQTSLVSPNKIVNGTREYGLYLANNDGAVNLIVYRVAISYKVTVPGPASATRLSGSVDGRTVRSNR